MNPAEPIAKWRSALGNLRIWKRGDERAPHKPLLTLMLLARAAAGDDRHVRFTDVEDKLSHLLREFGPSRKSYHPEFPFWHLQSDGIWVVENSATIPMKRAGHSPTRKILESSNAVGFVPEPLWNALQSSPSLRGELAEILLENFWPSTLHAAIRQAVGLPDAGEIASSSTRTARDPRFREEILRAYERRCAVCGYDGRLANVPLGLDAAHIRWRAYDGPDQVDNGLALCAYHHIALDSGALGLSNDLKIQVSCDVTGMQVINELLYRFVGRPLQRPQSAYPPPSQNFLEWHRREVFHAPERKAGYAIVESPRLLAAESDPAYPDHPTAN